jgi:hypothetical protein
MGLFVTGHCHIIITDSEQMSSIVHTLGFIALDLYKTYSGNINEFDTAQESYLENGN